MYKELLTNCINYRNNRLEGLLSREEEQVEAINHMINQHSIKTSTGIYNNKGENRPDPNPVTSRKLKRPSKKDKSQKTTRPKQKKSSALFIRKFRCK